MADVRRATAIGLVASLVFILGAGIPASNQTVASFESHSEYGGLFQYEATQSVSGQGFYADYCLNDSNSSSCLLPNGFVWIPPLQLVVGTTWIGPATPDAGARGADGEILIEPGSNVNPRYVLLPCAPFDPIYPGSGSDYVAACYNNSGSWITEINPLSGAVIWKVPQPPGNGSYGLGWDPEHNTAYVLTENLYDGVRPVNSTIYAIDPASGTARPVYSFPKVPNGWISPELSFDSNSGDLLVPSSGNGLLAINPETGTLATNISLEGQPLVSQFDASSNQVYVGLWAPYAVQVFNATTYRPTATISLSDKVGNNCCLNAVTSFAKDPGNGDVYALSPLGVIAINTSSESIVGSFENYGGGFPWNTAFVPGIEELFGSWPTNYQPYGFVAILTHSTGEVLVNFLGLTPPDAILVLGVTFGGLLGVVLGVLNRRHSHH